MKTVAKCENGSEPSLMRSVLSYVERTLRPTPVVGKSPDQSWWTGHKISALASDGVVSVVRPLLVVRPIHWWGTLSRVWWINGTLSHVVFVSPRLSYHIWVNISCTREITALARTSLLVCVHHLLAYSRS